MEMAVSLVPVRFGGYTREEDVALFAEVLRDTVKALRKGKS